LTDELLRERSGGNLEGQPLALLDAHKASGDFYTFRLPDGGESWMDVRSRQVPFLNKLLKTYPNGSILIVSHGGPVRGIRSLLEGKGLEEVDVEGTPNAGIWEETMSEPVHE
jgi:broad specificity phosphatase PhoE